MLLADGNNPDGGIFERFPGLYIPILDESFSGPTPPDTPYPTDVYTTQYHWSPTSRSIRSIR